MYCDKIFSAKRARSAAAAQRGCALAEILAADQPIRQPGDLEEADVPALEHLAQVRFEVLLHHQRVRHVEDGQFLHLFRVVEGQTPGNHGAPVMPGQAAILASQGIQQPEDILLQLFQAVSLDRLWHIAQVVTALVGYHHPVAGLCQRFDLVDPTPPELREAVQQHHQRSIHWPGLHHMQADAIGLDVCLFERGIFHEVDCIIPARTPEGTV